MLNQFTIGERPNKKNIELLDLTRKVIFYGFDVEFFFYDNWLYYVKIKNRKELPLLPGS